MNRKQLAAALEAEGFKTDSYDLTGGTPEDTYCLEDRGYEWAVYYSERGKRFDEEIFFDEGAACAFFLQLLRGVPPTNEGHKEQIARPE